MSTFIRLFIAFFKIGGLTIGGGYAMLPMMQKEIVDHYHWATSEEMMDYYALSQCTPGAIAVNVATFIGYRMKKIQGAFVATLGLVMPSFIIITLIASVLSNYMHLSVMQDAFAGMRVGVAVLMANSVIKLAKKALIDWKTIFIFVLVLSGSLLTDISPVIFVIVSGVLGIFLSVKGGKTSP